MLSPDVNPTMDQLAQAYSTVLRVDSFAYAAMSSTIGKLSPDPDWLGPMRDELALLRGAGGEWQLKKERIWAPLLGQFRDYGTLISSVADVAKELSNDRGAWVELLTGLTDSLRISINASRAAELDFKLQVNNLNNVQTVFSSSIAKAWAALDQEETKMVALAEEIGTLNERLANLQTNLTANAISSGKSYVVSTVSMAYSLMTAASFSVPFLSIAGLLFTVGKGVYDIIATDQEIAKSLDRIRDLSVEMSAEAQAAAMSKAIIQLISAFDQNLAAVGRQLPVLSTMWSNQEQKVQAVISAIQAGANPREILDLVSLKAAAATWQTLSDFTDKLVRSPPMGRPVTLSTAPPVENTKAAQA